MLIALLSINVAVLNLLPIPILDGGQILINIAESAKGSPFSMRTREYILRFGLVAILLIFAILMYNDTRADSASCSAGSGRLRAHRARRASLYIAPSQLANFPCSITLAIA